MRTTSRTLLVTACLTLFASTAFAQDAKPDDAAKKDDAAEKKKAPERPAPTPEEMEKAKAAYVKGAELFEAKKFDEAVKEFKESYRLSRNPLLLYNVGFTLDELGNKDKALFYYTKFLKDAPADAQNREVAQGRVKALSREVDADSLFAGGQGAGTTEDKGKTKTDANTAEPGAKVDKFQHNVVEEIPPGKPLDITAFVPDGVDWQVKLFFRAAGEGKFTSVEMRPRYNELVGRVPASKTLRVSMIQYYIEVKDKAGKIIDRSGRSTSPHLVMIEKGAKPRFYPDLNDDRSWEAGGSGAQTGEPRGDGSFTDIHSSKFKYAKWGATGGAVGLLALSATFYFIASDASSTLEGEAFSSASQDGCPSPPCRAFSNKQKDLQSRGENFELMSKITFGVGLVAGAAAGMAWYWEIRKGREEASDTSGVAAVPVVGKDYVGAAAALRF